MCRRKQPWLTACLLVLLGTPAVLLHGDSKAVPTPDILLPRVEKSLRFAVIGDSGTGGRAQHGIGRLMARSHLAFPFQLVLMLGDNLYGSEDPDDYERKFERPYKALLDAGVRFYAALGNHDEPAQRFYKLFNMNERRFYTFRPQDGIRFFALDSTYVDAEQLEWIEKELKGSDSGWKLCFFHHPIYSSGRRHGSDVELRAVLEPLFVRYGVDAVFSGHEHFYERLKPQNNVAYFISGAAGKLRRGNIAKSDLTITGFDRDYSFMLIEILRDEMHFQTIALSGKTVDHGVVRRREAATTLDRTELSAALLEAAARGDTNDLRKLILEGADVNSRDERDWTTSGFPALMWSAMEGRLEAARFLLASGATVDARDRNDGATALMRAADNGWVNIAEVLLEHGADVKARDRHGWTALMGAAEHGHGDLVELLLQHGGDANARHPLDGTDALMLAAEEGHVEVVRILLDSGANPSGRDSDGRTALMRAVEIGRTDIIKPLVSAGASPDQPDYDGWTAWREAHERNEPDVLNALRNREQPSPRLLR